MIQIIYSFFKNKPEGGQGFWTEELKLYDGDIKADDLQAKINEYLKDDHCSYHTGISVKSITRI